MSGRYGIGQAVISQVTALRDHKTTGAAVGLAAALAAAFTVSTSPVRAPETGSLSVGSHHSAHTHHRSSGEDGEGSEAASEAAPVTASEVVDLAKEQVGIEENAQGGGTKFQEWYVDSKFAKIDSRRDGGSPAGYKNASWCDMFVSWVGAQTDATPQMGADAFAPAHADWFKEIDRWGHKPKPGAVVFFSFDGGGIEHVGLVVKNNHNGTITTVEGNTDDSVKKRKRDKSTVVGYGYPKYST